MTVGYVATLFKVYQSIKTLPKTYPRRKYQDRADDRGGVFFTDPLRGGCFCLIG